MKKTVIFFLFIVTFISCWKNETNDELTKTQPWEARLELESTNQWGWWESSEQKASR